MKISGGEHINQCIHFLNQSSATFKKWWDEPSEIGGPSRKEQFTLLLKGDPATVDKLKISLERYLAKPLSSRNAQAGGKSPPGETKEAMFTMVKELDSVLKAYASNPLPRLPSKIPLEEFTSPSSSPPSPPKGFPEPPDKPVPPIPLNEDLSNKNLKGLEMEPPNNPPPSPPIFQKARASKEGTKSMINMGTQRMTQPTRPLPPLPQESPPALPNTAAIAPKRRPAPQRPNPRKGVRTVTEPSSSLAPKTVEASPIKPVVRETSSLAGPSAFDFQDIKSIVNGKVEVDIEKNLLRDLVLGENKADTANQDSRQLRGEAVLKKYKVLQYNQSYNPSRDKSSVGELMQMLEQKGRELQKNMDRWYTNNGGSIQF
jgi:hypothetical protein